MTSLDELLVSGEELDKELVGGVLKPLLRIDRETCGIRPQATWRSATNQVRVLAFLLARKAMIALQLGLDREAASPAEIIRQTGLPSGSVYPTLKELYERRPQLVDKDDNSRYCVPGWAVADACEVIRTSVAEQGG